MERKVGTGGATRGHFRPLLAVLLAVTGCGGASAHGNLDAGDRSLGPAGEASGMEAGAADGQAAATDGASNAPPDGNVPDTSDSEAGPVEAGHGTRSLRAEICGDQEDWPLPFPDGNRTAQPVGSESFGFLEGPVWIHEQGVLLFSDMDMQGDDAQGPPARIRRFTPQDSFDVFAPASNSNGLALLNDGSALLAATHDNQGLSLFELTTGARTPIAILFEGKRLNSPNDLVVRSDGTVYFTDPAWQLGPRSSETGMMGVYRVAVPPGAPPSELAAALVEGTLDQPNGIALSPDERTLYVGSAGDEIWKYEVRADGSVGGRAKFAETGPSDGLTVDCAGNLYVTSGAVEVFAPSGSKLGDIHLAGDPTNLAFGGSARKTLYITAGSRLYAILLNVPGFPY